MKRVRFWFPDHNFRSWLSRKLLSFVARLDHDTPYTQQANEHWQFNRRWQQPCGGQVSAPPPSTQPEPGE